MNTSQTDHRGTSLTISVHGNLLISSDSLSGLFRTDAAQIVDLPGEFWVEVRESRDVTLICSRNGLQQCFYFWDGNELHVGSTVLEVQRAAQLAWKWNWRALACLSYFGHLLGSDTLHPDICRLGAGEIVRLRGGKLAKQVVPEPEATPVRNPVDHALRALQSFVEQHGSNESVVPLSAGFDSRLLLAAFLHSGFRPRTWVMGDERSTDVRIARAIAERFDLELIHSQLPEDEYFVSKQRILELTSGTKTPDNWHSYVGVKCAKLEPACKLFPGSNGEFARTFFFDRGAAFYAADIGSRWTVSRFWDEKLKRFATLPRRGVAAELSYYFQDGRKEIFDWLLEHYGKGKRLGEVIEEFYLRERVRNFISNGIMLYSDFASVYMPLLSPEWISAVRQMPRRMKLGNAWHRYAIGRLCPELLEFATDDSGMPMRVRPISYWLGRAGHGPSTSYAPDLVRSRRYREELVGALPFLNDVFDPKSAQEFAQNANTSPRSLAYLGTVAFWSQLVQTVLTTAKTRP